MTENRVVCPLCMATVIPQQKMYCTICPECRVVLMDTGAQIKIPVTLPAGLYPNRIDALDMRQQYMWEDNTAEPNGIGPVCKDCHNLIDWHPDHALGCPWL